MLVAIGTNIIQWLLSKGFITAEHWIILWWNDYSSKKTLKSNKEILQKADTSGDLDAIRKADQDALNNRSK